MPIYYFHLCDGADIVLDPEGREVPSNSVEEAAFTEARAIIAADAASGHIHLDQQIEVRDADGRTVCRVEFEDAVTVTHLAVRIST